MTLPTEKRETIEINPRFSIFFGKPKSGKTTLIQGLEDALHIDFEDGSSYVRTMSVGINSVAELRELVAALTLAKSKTTKEYLYKFLVLDTATALEDLCLPLALDMYRKTPMGKSFGQQPDGSYKNADVRTLPNGAGYLYTREAFKSVLTALSGFSKYVILLGHTKERAINVKGKELNQNALDLAGKLERIISAKADALGYVYRDKNETKINFNGGKDSIVEARPTHLRGKEFVVADSDDDGNMTYYWDRIFK